MTRSVHVPYTVEQDEDRVWCAHAQLRPGVGANGEGETEEAAIADLREALIGFARGVRRSGQADTDRRRSLMAPVPSVRGERLVRALERAGFKVARVAGSHHVMRHPDGRGTTVPVHPRREPLRNILADTTLTIEELQRLLSLTGPERTRWHATLPRRSEAMSGHVWLLSSQVSVASGDAARRGAADCSRLTCAGFVGSIAHCAHQVSAGR